MSLAAVRQTAPLLSERARRVASLLAGFEPPEAAANASIEPVSVAFVLESVHEELAQILWSELPRLAAKNVEVFGLFAELGGDRATRSRIALFEQAYGAGSAAIRLQLLKPQRARTTCERLITGHKAAWFGGQVLHPDPDDAGALSTGLLDVTLQWNAFHLLRATGASHVAETQPGSPIEALLAPIRAFAASLS